MICSKEVEPKLTNGRLSLKDVKSGKIQSLDCIASAVGLTKQEYISLYDGKQLPEWLRLLLKKEQI